MRKALATFLLLVSSMAVNADIGGWSGWLTVSRIDFHPTWVLNVVFEEDIIEGCGKNAKWSASSNEVFMDRIISTMLAAKVSGAKVRVWLHDCDDGVANVNQTQLQ